MISPNPRNRLKKNNPIRNARGNDNFASFPCFFCFFQVKFLKIFIFCDFYLEAKKRIAIFASQCRRKPVFISNDAVYITI